MCGVYYKGNLIESFEEVEVIFVELWQLFGLLWIDEYGIWLLVVFDVFVFVLYNVQVVLVCWWLVFVGFGGVDGVWVGIVDKFQGGQVLVVFILMMVLFVDDVLCGILFLFNWNWFNVVVSWVQYVVVIVCLELLIQYLFVMFDGLVDLGVFFGLMLIS